MIEEIDSKKLCFISPTFPPHISGIADHTAFLAQTVAKTASVKVLTTVQKDQSFPEVTVEQIFSLGQPKSILKIVDAVIADQPDWIVVQYDPFSYGVAYGINPYLPLMLTLLKNRCPQLKMSIIVHETFRSDHSLKSTLLSTVLTTQLWMICRLMDVIFIVVEPWIPTVKRWFPNKIVQHLPVSSNILQTTTIRDQARARLGINSQTIVLGLFGRMQGVRNLEHIILAAKKVIHAGLDVLILYVGLDPSTARNRLNMVPLMADGPLTANEISERFTAMDIYLAPFDEGVSTRRTSFMASLQHGLATVATYGTYTDQALLDANHHAFILTDSDQPEDFASEVLNLALNPAHRQDLASNAKSLFQQEYTWESIASKLLNTIRA